MAIGTVALLCVVGVMVADGYARFRERREADSRWANGWLFYTPGEGGRAARGPEGRGQGDV
jgi:hypothetical protein